MRILLIILASVAISIPSLAQVTYNGVTLPATIKAGDMDISLNGGGVRKKLFFKLYTGGLYLEEKTGDASKIINTDKGMAVKLQITSSMISSENMSEAINEGFAKSTKNNTAPLKNKIAQFVATFGKEEIVEGNIFDIVYVPGTGVESYKNGKLQSTIDGMDFKKALFGIWLCDEPADEDLKKGMLGN
jgi:hypothetical protein